MTGFDYSHLFSRQGGQRTDRVIETLALEPGTRVADVGASASGIESLTGESRPAVTRVSDTVTR